MTSAISSGLQGYERAETLVNRAAANIGNSSPATAATSFDSADLSSNAISLLEGKDGAQANLATIHVSEQIQQSLLDLVG